MTRFGLRSVVLGYLVLVLIAGGASSAGLPANALLQILGAVLIGVCLWRPDPGAVPLPRLLRWALVAAAVTAAVQFLPLPPALWTLLPGREPIARGIELLDRPLPWMTLSLDPWATVGSMAWWIPAAAVLVGMLRADRPSLRTVTRAVVAVAVASIALGAMQRAGSGAYLYSVTNYGFGTGFFANANHQASFLLATLALWSADFAAREKRAMRPERHRAAQGVFFAVALLLVIGVLLSNSLAGIGLLIPVIAGVVLLGRTDLRLTRPMALAGLAALAAATAAFALYGSLELNPGAAATAEPGQDRLVFLVTGLAAAGDMAPFGSGLGTFLDVYKWYEDPAQVTRTYVNHAHNDLLELVIETGVFGLAALGLFLLWWVRRAADLWRNHRREPFALAATLLTGAVLAHSLVDYPLRTAAMSSLFAVGIAIIVRPATAAVTGRRRTGNTEGALVRI